MTQTLNLPSCSQIEVSPQHLNVSEMMNSWTSQKGFPLVTVSCQGDEVTLTQEHFLLTADNGTHNSRWVTIDTQTDTKTHRKHNTALIEFCVLFSLWNIPVTYVNDSCSLGPECRQVFTLKTKSGETERIILQQRVSECLALCWMIHLNLCLCIYRDF